MKASFPAKMGTIPGYVGLRVPDSPPENLTTDLSVQMVHCNLYLLGLGIIDPT